MPSCHRRTATPAENVKSSCVCEGTRPRKGRGMLTEARPEEDFGNHCGCESGRFGYRRLEELCEVRIWGGYSLNGLQWCLNRRSL